MIFRAQFFSEKNCAPPLIIVGQGGFRATMDLPASPVTSSHPSIKESAMTTLELKLNLPDRLAQDAAKMGLLDPDSLQTMLREAVRNRRIAQLALARQRVAEAGIAPMSLEEIQEEVDAQRAELHKSGRAQKSPESRSKTCMDINYLAGAT